MEKIYWAVVAVIILLLLFYLSGYSGSRGSNLMLKWTYRNNSIKSVLYVLHYYVRNNIYLWLSYYDLDVQQHVLIYDFGSCIYVLVIISYELNALSMKMSKLLYRMPFQFTNEAQNNGSCKSLITKTKLTHYRTKTFEVEYCNAFLVKMQILMCFAPTKQSVYEDNTSIFITKLV
jgi:hypothetical protein